jgi:hypothetical protein
VAITVATDYRLSVAGTDLSDHVRRMTVTMTAEDIDLTAMGATARAHAPGLRDDRISVEFFQDYASSKVDQTLYPLVGSAAGGTIVAQPASGGTSTSNPTYTMVGVLLDYNPMDAEVGQAPMNSVVFVPAQGSKITRGTA